MKSAILTVWIFTVLGTTAWCSEPFNPALFPAGNYVLDITHSDPGCNALPSEPASEQYFILESISDFVSLDSASTARPSETSLTGLSDQFKSISDPSFQEGFNLGGGPYSGWIENTFDGHTIRQTLTEKFLGFLTTKKLQASLTANPDSSLSYKGSFGQGGHKVSCRLTPVKDVSP